MIKGTVLVSFQEKYKSIHVIRNRRNEDGINLNVLELGSTWIYIVETHLELLTICWTDVPVEDQSF